jgi:hypothetical protein
MGSRKGIKNKRTILREQRMAEATKAAADGKVDTSIRKDGVEVMEEAMLYFFALAEQERRRGDKGDRKQICEWEWGLAASRACAI